MAAIAERVTAERGLELVEVQLVGGARGGQVRVFVDRPGGIDVEDLRTVSLEISALLDASDPIQGRYRLEVSSPGLDRPLRSAADFRRNAGRLLAVESRDLATRQTQRYRGRLLALEDGALSLAVDGQPAPVSLPLEGIVDARPEIEIPRGRPGGRKNRKTRKAHG